MRWPEALNYFNTNSVAYSHKLIPQPSDLSRKFNASNSGVKRGLETSDEFYLILSACYYKNFSLSTFFAKINLKYPCKNIYYCGFLLKKIIHSGIEILL